MQGADAKTRTQQELMMPSARPLAGAVAVMQPYFFPYAGYFRLLAAAETFIIFDDVQFPRRGRVHRCQLPRPGGGEEWLTLPLAQQPREVLIRDLAFADEARQALDRRLDRLDWLAAARGPMAEALRAHLRGELGRPADFIEAGLRLVAQRLELPARLVRSSSFCLDPALRGQERVLALVAAAGGRTYVNAPGGRALYQAEAFRRRGIELRFLAPYSGPFRHLLPALASASGSQLREDILGGAVPDPL
jgi:hypothetical protein